MTGRKNIESETYRKMKKVVSFIVVYFIVFVLYIGISIPINNYVERAWLCRPGDWGIGLPMFKYWIHVGGELQHGGDGGVLLLNFVIVLFITIVLNLVRKKLRLRRGERSRQGQESGD